MHEIKNAAGKNLLQVVAVDPATPQVENWEHGVIWRGVNEVRIALGNLHWYGGGGLVHQQYPLEKLAQFSAPFITSDNGATGLLGTLHPFWWTSNGAGILVESDAMDFGFNAPLEGKPFEHSFTDPSPLDQRPQLAAIITGDGNLHIQGENLTLRFFVGDNPRQVVEAFWHLIEISLPPPYSLIERPLWTTWAHFKNDISHDKVVDFARQIKANGFTCSILGIDAKWQAEFGETRFDPRKFPDAKATMKALHELDMAVTLWCVPFFMEHSQHFAPAIEKGFVIRNEDGTPYIGEWWEGRAAFLDVTLPGAMQWHLDNLQALATEVGIDGFKFDAGEGMFYNQPGTLRYDNGAPNRANRAYIEAIAARFPWSDIRSAWFCQSQPMLFRHWDKMSVWGFDNGLASCITQAITLNMVGYPYSFPDMIGGNQYRVKPDAELMIRWTQAVAPMPILQFSIPPWQFGEECRRLCVRYNQLHTELAPRLHALAKTQQPIVRPLWWAAPQDEVALVCADQYLIGDDLLVAPVITPQTDRRDIYLPAGRWRSYWNHREVHEGGKWLYGYPAPLDMLPLFERS